LTTARLAIAEGGTDPAGGWRKP